MQNANTMQKWNENSHILVADRIALLQQFFSSHFCIFCIAFTSHYHPCFVLFMSCALKNSFVVVIKRILRVLGEYISQNESTHLVVFL